MRRTGLSLILAVGFAACACAATVTDIAIVNIGRGPLDEGALRAYIRTSVGAEFEQNLVQADVRKLLDTGRYEDVEALVEKSSAGVRVVYRAKQNRILLGEVGVEGVERFSPEDIRDWLELLPGAFISDAIVGAKIQKVLDEYRDRLYADATPTWKIADADPAQGLATLLVSIREGERQWIRSVSFPGATVFSKAKLRQALSMRAWYNPARLFRKEKFDASDLELGRLTIREWYADLGYLDARIGKAILERDPAGGVNVTMAVEEGPVYSVGQISLQGAERFPEADLLQAAGLGVGALASSSAIDAAVRGVTDYYGSRGYVDTTVQAMLGAGQTAGQVSVRLVVREGEQVTVRNVRIRGNSVTRDKVMRRELTIYPGDILNEVEAGRSERRLQNLGFFSSVRHYTEETPVPSERDLVYEVEEGRSGQMMIGAGFSSVDNLMLFLDITHGNFDLSGWPFRGAGQKLKLNVQFGGTRKDVSVSFTEPWFMDKRLQLGTEFYHTDVDYDDYKLRRYGMALSLTKGLFGRVRGTAQYRIERESISDLADTNQYIFVNGPEDTSLIGYESPTGTNTFDFADTYDRLSSSMRFVLSYDDRNHPFIPSRGSQASAYFQVTGGPFGGDTKLYETGLKGAYYVSPWFRHVLSFQASYDTVETYGDGDTVSIGDRLFAGGGRTIRGFRYRHVGPKVAPVTGDTIDPHGYRPYGGQSRALGTIEYTIPLFSMLRFAAFYDTGNVWSDPFEMEWTDMSASTGVGLRFDIPGFPIRIDRAWVLHKDDPLTEEDVVVFWIGY